MAPVRLAESREDDQGQHPSPATVMRLLRDHDDKAAVAAAAG
jgi:hypothetical protein